MSFQNLYYQRTAATPRSCTVCLRPTTIVLSTLGDVDFVYTCERHLTDPGFASRVPDVAPTPKKEVDEGEVKKVKEEWEEKQKRKKEKEEKEKEKEKEKAAAGDADKDKEKEKDKKKDKPVEPAKSPVPTPPAPSRPKYTLHRHIFASRQLEHRKRRQLKEAREIAPRLPGVPGGLPR